MRDQSKVEPETLGRRILEGDRLALARGLTRIENRMPEGRELLDFLFHHTGSSVRIGLTGPPGSGKSTLVSLLARKFRDEGHQVGILAIDPTSPFTGGAILGDRIRMGDLTGDAGIFIRSMATRGHQGGLSATTYEASEVLEAAGFDVILIETVGVGQSELEIASAADTTLVILVPESGDAIQVMKAGVMEIGDIFVVNKYDRQGGDHLLKEIHAILDLSPPDRHDSWKPKVLPTTASMGLGIDDLMKAIQAHKESRETDETARARIRREKLKERMRLLLSGRLLGEAWTQTLEARLEDALDQVADRRVSPYGWVDETVDLISRKGWKE